MTTEQLGPPDVTADSRPAGPAEHESVVDESTPRAGLVRRLLFGLRTRLVLWYLVLLAVAAGLTIFGTRQVLLVRLDERIDAELRQEIEELTRLADGDDPATGEPFQDDVYAIFDTFLRRNVPSRNETFLAIELATGEGLRPTTDPPYALDTDREIRAYIEGIRSPERGTFSTPMGEVDYHAVTLEAEGDPLGVFVVAIFSDLLRAETNDVVRVVSVIFGVLLVFVSFLAWGAAGRVVAPVTAVTATARRINDTDLTRRIPLGGAAETTEMAATFNAMLDRLEEALAAQRRFVDDAGHELRTPITIIRGHLELMGDDPEERRETIALVTDELDRMHRMVEDLLILAKAERPDFLALRVVDVARLTEEVFAKAQAIAPRDWRLAAAAPGRAVVDRQRITQALVQLAQNAVQHTSAGGRIAIGSFVRDHEAGFWVSDDGEGVPDGEAQRIFGRFHRGEAGRRRGEGAGLGLSIAQAIAMAHGGRIELHSLPGMGATFTVVVPVDPPSEPALVPQEP
ncbi:ATP-binding protein [soil metagenome]